MNRIVLPGLCLLAVLACRSLGPASRSLRDVTYCSPGGVDQKMDIYFPASGAGPFPLILFVHGGGWAEGDKSDLSDTSGMTRLGYIVASINYRMAPAYRFPAMIEDTRCAVRYLRAHAEEYHLDPGRIAAMGGSAGGHLVALLGTADESAGWDVGEYLDQSSRVQAVIVTAGPADLTADFPDAVDEIILQAFGSDPALLAAASPISHASPDDPPFLIFQGDRDELVPLEQAQILHAYLREAGVSSTLVIVENGDHGLQGAGGPTRPAGDEIARIMLDFLQNNLKPSIR